jgi:peroxiredoxin
MKTFFGIVAICVLSTQCGARAQQNVNAQSSTSLDAATFEVSKYPALRVGDIAPQWSLLNSTGQRIQSRDMLGQTGYGWIINGDDAAKTPSDTKPKSAGTSGNDSTQPVTALRITSRGTSNRPHSAFYIVNDYYVTSQLARLLSNAFDVRPKQFKTVEVDRAGFIRSIGTVAPRQAPNTYVIPDSFVLEVGKLAPDFSIPDMNGVVRRVSDLRGKKNLLLTFFPKCFTGGCTNHLSGIQKEHLSYIASETEVWAVSVDPAEGEKGQKAFAERWNLQFPLIPDEGRNLSILYGAAENPVQLASRMSVLIDKDGIVRLIDKKVDVYTHGNDIIMEMRRNGMIPPPQAASPTGK